MTVLIPRLTKVSEPAFNAVTLARVKEHCRIASDETAEDDILNLYISAATTFIENEIGRSIIDTTYDQHQDNFPTGPILLSKSPLLAVEGVFYRQGIAAEVEFEDYGVDYSGKRGCVFPLSSWPTITAQPGAVRIRFRAGYISTAFSPPVGTVPQDIEAAMLLLIATFYANRENEMVGAAPLEMPIGVKRILQHYIADLQVA